MRAGRSRRWSIMIAVCALGLAACGGANSASGSSAANCVDALQQAMQTAPHADSFRGLAQVNARGLEHLGFGRVTSGQYCVVMFLNRSLSTRQRFVLDLYGYTERPVHLVGHVRHERREPRLLDLASMPVGAPPHFDSFTATSLRS